MHKLLDVRPWPHALLRYPLLILTAFLLGALLAFAYSYAPLHSSKDWKIDYLEERLESRNEQVGELEAELEKARASLDGTASDEEVQALRKQLAEATKLADSRRSEIASLEKKVDRATRDRDTWKKRHATAMKELEEQTANPAAPAPDLVGEPETTLDSNQAEPAPAAPSPAQPFEDPIPSTPPE